LDFACHLVFLKNMSWKLALLLSSGKEAPNLVDALHQAVFSHRASPFLGLCTSSIFFNTFWKLALLLCAGKEASNPYMEPSN
jgi:hypothetical protein